LNVPSMTWAWGSDRRRPPGMTDEERVLVVMYAWHVAGVAGVDFEELGFVGELSRQGRADARAVIRRDPAAAALFETTLRTERTSRD
jgi:hypothetical protein